MKDIIKKTIAPLLSLFIFMLGSGLFTTLLSVRLHHEGATSIFIGALTGAYYAGLSYGSFKIEHHIVGVGYIRSFAAFASLLATISFLQGVFLANWAWLLLRFTGGFATAGIFIVVESWLLSVGNSTSRGKILALYMISLYGAQALGQFLLNLDDPKNLMLFALTAMLCSLSVIPIALTKNPSPEISEPSSLNFKKLFKVSASGVIGSFSAGLLLGAIYGLLPLVIMQKHGDTSDVGLLMALLIFGGMFLQYPVGKISDYIERRLVLLALSALTIVASTSVMLFFAGSYALYTTLFIFGGLIFTIYPVSISHACDSLNQNEIISGTQGILLAYSIGAIVGPFIAPAFMRLIGPNGLFIYVITVSALLTVFLSWRKIYIPSTPSEESFIAVPQTSPVTAELDPRSDAEAV